MEIQSKTAARISICTLNSLYLPSNQIHIWFILIYNILISCRGSVNPSTPTFPNMNLAKKLRIYLLFRKSLKIGCNNLYIHTYTFDGRWESFSYLTSLSRRGPVNPSTPIFLNINLRETITNLIAAWKFNLETAAKISICTLSPLNFSWNQIHIWC